MDSSSDQGLTLFAPVFRLNGPLPSGWSPALHPLLPVLMMLPLLVPKVCAEDSATTSLQTGRALQQALKSRRALTVQAVPLRKLLSDLQTQSEICLVLDRRLDPSQRLTFKTELMATRRLLHLVVAEIPQADVSINQSFVYIGPVRAAQRLRTLCELNRKMLLEARNRLDPEVYSAVSSRKSVEWQELSRPVNVLSELCASNGLTVRNPEALPADLWHAGRWSNMPFAESMTLLLNQFDLTFRVDGGGTQLEIVDIPEVIAIKQRHMVPRRRRESARQLLPSRFPDLAFEWKSAAVHVAATWEQHEQIEALLKGTELPGKRPADSLKTRLFTLTLPDDLKWQQLIEQLQDSGIVIRIEADLGQELEQTVSGSFRQMPGADFFPKLFSGLPVQVQVLDGEVVLKTENGE